MLSIIIRFKLTFQTLNTIFIHSSLLLVRVLWLLVRELAPLLVEGLAQGCLSIRLLRHAWLHRRHLVSVAWRHLARWHARGLTSLLCGFTTGQVTRHLKIANLLLQLEQLVVQLRVELVGLVEVICHLLLRDDCLVQLVKVGGLRRVQG